MANLFNKYIYETYKSIIGIGDSGTSGLGANPQPLTDGEGKHLPIEVSETEVNLTAPTTVPNLFIEGYGEVIDENGYWTGEGGGGGGGGTSGTSGTSGLTGTSGTSGINGTSGTSGTSGRNGYAGLNGSNGSSGTDGTSGTSGIDGAAGTSGTSGLDGTNGTSGTSGIDGTQNLLINNASVGTVLPGGNYYGVTNITPPNESLYIPDNAQNVIAIGYYSAVFDNAIFLGHYGQAQPNTVIVGHNSFDNAGQNTIVGNGNALYNNTSDCIVIGRTNDLNPANNTPSNSNVVVANNATVAGERNIAIGGTGFSIDASDSIAIGAAQVSGDGSIAIGRNVQSFGAGNIAIGDNVQAINGDGIAIGAQAQAFGVRGVAIGKFVTITEDGDNATGIGNDIDLAGADGVAIGSRVNVALNAYGAVALGRDLTASTIDTVTIHKLQMIDYATLDFIDDTAAAGAGIPLGGVYHTNGTLKIRIA